MMWTRTKIAVVVGASALLAATTAVLIKVEADSRKAAIFEPIFSTLDRDNLDKLPPTLILRPTSYPDGEHQAMSLPTGKFLCANLDPVDFIEEAFAASRVRTLFQEGNGPLMVNDDDNHAINAQEFFGRQKMGCMDVDCVVTLADHQQEALRAEVKKQLGLDVRYETRQTDLLVLQVLDTPKLKVHLTKGGTPTTKLIGNNHTNRGRAFTNEPMSVVARWLEGLSGKPVVDATGLEDRYDVIIEWSEKRSSDWQTRRESIRQALENQCGLTLLPNRDPTKMLVIQRVKN